RPEATVVIMTLLPAAQPISPTWLNPITMLGQPSAVSTNRVSGGQFSAATRARLPRATIIAVLTTDCLFARAQPIRKPVARPNRPAINQTINQTPLRGGPAPARTGRTATGPAGR